MSGSPDLELSLDAFVRSVGVNRATPHAFFLGAGASISSGMPSAEMCVWEWKRSIFLTRNPGLEDQFRELSLPAVKTRIQRWLDSQGAFPASGAADEYGYYIGQCFPIPEDRRRFFQAKIQEARPGSGYRLLCCLAEESVVDTVWSVNFDGLSARAAADFSLTPVEVGIDSQSRVVRQPRRGELLTVSLHGDYRYDYLKNTPDELQHQEALLRDALVDRTRNCPLVVSGYSGRDTSVMEAMRVAYGQPGRGTLYWCGYGDDIPETVAELIRVARAAGRAAYYVSTQGFDDLLSRIALHCLEGEPLAKAKAIAATGIASGALPCSDFAVSDRPTAAVIKSNAFPLKCPPELYQFDVDGLPERNAWEWLEAEVGDRDLALAPFKNKVLAIGTLADIQACFGTRLRGAVERVPISDMDLALDHGVIVSLLKRALIRSIARTRGMETDGRDLLWNPAVHTKRPHQGAEYRIHEALILFVRRVGGETFAVFKPTIRAYDRKGAIAPEEAERKLKIEILGWQHNDKFNQAMERWRERLLPDRTNTFEFPVGCGSSFRFDVERVPVYAKLAARRRSEIIDLLPGVQKLVRYSGFCLDEPPLIFASSTPRSIVTDGHPVRGIVNNRPFDFDLTRTGLAPSVRLGIVCPGAEARFLSGHLRSFGTHIRPGRYDEEYLLDFPGFQNAFGLPLEIPMPGGAGWETCAEPNMSLSQPQSCLELARSITRAIDALRASYAPNVILVFIPTRFNPITDYETEDERFDLHDFIKAYCVQHGSASQLLREQKLRQADGCRLWWWLSLALYVKSMRTPWILDGLDDDTAFVGIGYSVDRMAVKGQHIVLGCSHIYNARGEGLQYRLTKVENPIIRNKNCFLREDDARRVGETIRQLFFEAKGKLPGRVVIHKRTPFIRSEQDGLRQGLAGVPDIELVEINVDEALRFVASQWNGGKLQPDRYPIRRGTVLQIGAHEALLWVHGATDIVNPTRKYYQGKRRIPAPLVLRRYAGTSDLRRIATEILGLSKMDWNTFDLYKQFPATVESSGRIARIGSLIARHGVAYDYRLFI